MGDIEKPNEGPRKTPVSAQEIVHAAQEQQEGSDVKLDALMRIATKEVIHNALQQLREGTTARNKVLDAVARARKELRGDFESSRQTPEPTPEAQAFSMLADPMKTARGWMDSLGATFKKIPLIGGLASGLSLSSIEKYFYKTLAALYQPAKKAAAANAPEASGFFARIFGGFSAAFFAESLMNPLGLWARRKLIRTDLEAAVEKKFPGATTTSENQFESNGTLIEIPDISNDDVDIVMGAQNEIINLKKPENPETLVKRRADRYITLQQQRFPNRALSLTISIENIFAGKEAVPTEQKKEGAAEKKEETSPVRGDMVS